MKRPFKNIATKNKHSETSMHRAPEAGNEFIFLAHWPVVCTSAGKWSVNVHLFRLVKNEC